MIPLTDEENESYQMQRVFHIYKKEFCIDENEFKLNQKVRDCSHYTRKFREAAHSICNLRYKVHKEIPIVAHNAAYDHHFIIKQLAKEFHDQFECLGENSEKYITFSVPIKKELDKGKTSIYKLRFIDSFRFMSTSLLKLLKYLSDGLHSDRDKDCKSKLSCMSVKDNQCLAFKKTYGKDFNKELIKRFPKSPKFCNGDINKFVLLLRKGLYRYEYMDSKERFDETSLLDKKLFTAN